MALDAPFYLAVGDVVLEDGTGTTDYTVFSMSFPEPDSDGAGGHLPATRSISLYVDGTSASDLSANVAVLRRELVRDKYLYFSPDLSGAALSCRIREARMVEASYDPLRRSVTPFRATLSLAVTTDPYWLGSWSAEVDASGDVTYVPGHFDVSSVTGEVDAEFAIRVLPVREGRALYVAVKPDPDADYDYLDDYGTSDDTSDANAYGTYKKGAVADATLSEDMAAPAIDTAANEGRHLVIVRADSTATTATNNTAAVQSSVTGYNIATTTSVTENTVTFASNDLTGIELGIVSIPAGQVPDVQTEGGTTATTEGNAVDEGTLTLTADDTVLEIYQPFAGFDGYMTSFAYTVYVAASGTFNGGAFEIYGGSTLLYSQVLTTDPLTAGTHTLTLPTPVVLSSSTTYTARHRWLRNAQDWTVGVAYSNGDYADGELTTLFGSGESAGDALTFTVTGYVPNDFNSETAVLVACSESSKTIAIDYVQRIPLRHACIVYRPATSGSLGMFYDGSTPYIADADGIGYAILDKCEIRRPLTLKPGVTNRVILGILQEDAAVAGCTALAYKWRPRYLTATG